MSWHKIGLVSEISCICKGFSESVIGCMKLRDMGVCEVGDSGETAADGLYDSLSSLKAPNM